MSNNYSLINEFDMVEKTMSDHSSQTYKTIHRQTKKIFSIKIYPQKIFQSYENEIDYTREKAILFNISKKNNQNIPKLFSVLEDTSYRYLLFEYIPGRNLKDYIESQNQPLNEKLIIHILKEMLKISYFLHNDCFIMHRNVKPSNIIMDENNNNNIKLIGFHLSAYLKNSNHVLVSGKSPKGAKDYVAPEILFGNPDTLDYDYKCDIFSLGYTIYYLMNKELPTQTKFVNSKVVRIDNTLKNSNYSPWLIKLVGTLYDTDPKKRPTALEALKILENNLNNQNC